MKHNTKRLLALLLSLVLAISLVTPALGADGATVQETVKTLLESSGLTQEQLGDYPADYNALAESLGMIEDKDDQAALDAVVTDEQEAEMTAACQALYDALHNEDGSLKSSSELTPFFANGLAQPIFPYTSGCVSNVDNSQYSRNGGQPASEEVYDNATSDIIRYMVYVETNYDTDGDGKLDLVKALVQVPRAAAEGAYQAATIFEARPYITGCTDMFGSAKGYGDGSYDMESLYAQPDPRVPASEPVGTMEAAADADSNDWYYWNPYEDMYDYEDLTWYDYFLVRGFAVVESGGIGTRDSEGFETCGSDLEIDAFKCIVEWLHGDRVAYTDKTSNIPVVADWSAGSVGTTGRSYAGTTQFGLATTGVEGLKTIVPVAGISSWYEYTNAQGISLGRNPNYVDTLAQYCAGRYLDEDDWAQLFPAYGNYLNQLRQAQRDNPGDYFKEWERRDYTLNADNIQIPALIVHGLNDDNVRTKMSDQMYQAFKQAGQDVKFIFHQDGHLTPAYPAGQLEFEVGGRMYDEILNQWFSHYLCDVDNGAENLPAVLAQSNTDPDVWNTYDSWEAAENLVINGSAEDDVTITSDYNASGAASSTWRDIFSADSTDNSAMFVADVENETVVKGSVAVSFSATVANVDPEEEAAAVQSDEAAAAPRGAVDHDSYVDPANQAPAEDAALMADGDLPLSERNSLMVSAMLVDMSDQAFPTCSTTGSYVTKEYLSRASEENGGVWMGGGLDKFDFVKLTSMDVNYKIIARGWMDLCNPDAGFDSASAATRVALQEGQTYDYTIYLQPNLYTVPAGHQLAVVIFAYEPGKATYTQNYAITLDKDSVKADVPVETGAGTLDAVYQNDPNSSYLSVATARNGSVEQSVANGLVANGTEVTLTATAADGYQLTGWTVNGENVGTANPLTITVDKDTAVTPAFGRVTMVNLTVNEPQNGTVEQSVANGQVASGTQVTLTATANSGYSFTGWTVNGEASGLTNPLTLTVTADTEVTAAFAAQSSGGGGRSGGGSSQGVQTGTAAAYTVTAEKAENGAITVTPARAAAGATITVTLNPAEGYVPDTFSVKDASGAEPALTDKGNNTCTFTMPASNVTVTASFKAAETTPVDQPANDGGLPFTDVGTGAWYRNDVAYVYGVGLMNGTSETTFAPDQNTSRAMIVTILYRLEKEPAVTGENTFADVADGSWYADAVTWAQASGIVTGYDETTFGPNDSITREQLATILCRYAQYKEVPAPASGDLSQFNDADQVGSYAVEAMQWAVGAGLISGDNGGNLLPKGTAARSQVAAVLHRAADALKLIAE